VTFENLCLATVLQDRLGTGGVLVEEVREVIYLWCRYGRHHTQTHTHKDVHILFLDPHYIYLPPVSDHAAGERVVIHRCILFI
jgi:hypothetical protein